MRLLNLTNIIVQHGVLERNTEKKYDLMVLEARGSGGGRLAYERGGDARRLAQQCKFRILVPLRVFWKKSRYI